MDDDGYEMQVAVEEGSTSRDQEADALVKLPTCDGCLSYVPA